MPSTLICDMNSTSAALDDSNALQLAVGFSKLRVIGGDDYIQPTWNGASPLGLTLSQNGLSTTVKSQNTTECVPVPSSEHVAEIVGRQGCKIKALRAKTNTYIKTPVRGEDPLFVITGRSDDVDQAKAEILQAAEHFSQIRASRRANASNGVGGSPPSPTSNPGQVTIQVRVPYRVVGLVVGPKGATIKRIQQQTSTYIVTPSRDKEPIFELTGLPDNVKIAQAEIEAHIAQRTGGVVDPNDDFFRNGRTEVGTFSVDDLNEDQTGSKSSSGRSSNDLPASSTNGLGVSAIGSTSYAPGTARFSSGGESASGSPLLAHHNPVLHHQQGQRHVGLGQSSSFDQIASYATQYAVGSTHGSSDLSSSVGLPGSMFQNGPVGQSASVWPDVEFLSEYQPRRSGSLGSAGPTSHTADLLHAPVRRYGSHPLTSVYMNTANTTNTDPQETHNLLAFPQQVQNLPNPNSTLLPSYPMFFPQSATTQSTTLSQDVPRHNAPSSSLGQEGSAVSGYSSGASLSPEPYNPVLPQQQPVHPPQRLCAVCQMPAAYVLPLCGHGDFCDGCFTQHNQGSLECPTCRQIQASAEALIASP